MIIVDCCVLFFKQKTAYEMRISDWSSDVCSSDLQAGSGAEEVSEAAEGPGLGIRDWGFDKGVSRRARISALPLFPNPQSPIPNPHAHETRLRRHPRLRRPLADRRSAPQRGRGGVHPARPARRTRARADAFADQARGGRARDRGVPARIAEIAGIA